MNLSQYNRLSFPTSPPAASYVLFTKSRSSVYNHDRSNRSRAFVESSEVSYLFPAARHIFRSMTLLLNFSSLAASLCRLCQTEMPTRGAHSFLTKPLSRDSNALMMNAVRCVRTLSAKLKSTVMDNTRRKKEENSAGLSTKVAQAGRPSRRLTWVIMAMRMTCQFEEDSSE